MKKLWLIVLLVLTTGVVGAQDDMPLETITHDEMERTYRLFVPSSYDETTPTPLLLMLHPAGGDGTSFAFRTGVNKRAEEDGIIVAYPEGPQGYWDYGYGLPEWADVYPINDDVGFINALLDELIVSYNIDETQIYAVGHSNGARFAFQLGCALGDRLAGIGAVAATISEDIVNACSPESRVSVFYMHGTEDMSTPWEGKPLYLGAEQVTTAWSAPNTVNFWVAQNRCDVEPDIVDLPDANPEDEVFIRQVTFSGCDDDHQVVFYAVLGGGHGWLGGNLNLTPTNYNPSGYATEYLWEFLSFSAD